MRSLLSVRSLKRLVKQRPWHPFAALVAAAFAFLCAASPADAQVPGKPENVTVTADGPYNLTVTWTLPAGSPPATELYTIKYRKQGSGTTTTVWETGSPATLGTSKFPLEPGATYQVWVWAENDAGVGEGSDAATGTTEALTKPGKPAVPTVTQSTSEPLIRLKVSWTATGDTSRKRSPRR